ncbi:MAG: hypothetical protein ABSG71_03170 [Thermodesulfobacteriota bacterium]|jgi:hypothetical protein
MIKNWFLSRLPEWFVQWVVLPVAWLTFFGGVWVAAHRFPGEYDWRYMVISRLLRPYENPHGYWVIALGTSLSGLIQIPLPGFFYERLRGTSPWGARLGWVFMVLGLAAMILMGITRSIFPEVPHGVLAATAFIGLVLSVMVNTGLVVKQGLSRTAPKDSTMCWSWISLTVLALIPMVGTSLSQLYLYFFARGLGQARLVWQNRGVPFVFSLAFWEWLTCVFLIVYLMLLLGLTCRLKRKTLNNPHLPFRPKSDQANK